MLFLTEKILRHRYFERCELFSYEHKRITLFMGGSAMKTIALTIVVLMCVVSIANAGEVTVKENAEFYLLDSPSQRLKNPSKYFSHEYQQVNTRRGKNNENESRPAHLTALALSGGGIRSSAFQLGVLSGLFRSNNALSSIDYISSVSGGSWANGAYWASTVSDENFFNCLDKAAKLGNTKAECEAAVMLNSEQPFAELPIDNDFKLKARKRQWKEYIESIYLPNCNVDAEEIKNNGIPQCAINNYKAKPYIIINASHSVKALNQKGSERNMPFQFTLDYFGTLSDCFSKGACNENNQGFFASTLSKNFVWVNRALFRDDKPGNSLSAAMAASSGVVAGPVLLSYEYELITNNKISLLGNHRGDNIKGIRKEIVLSDGGKSENLGLVPLIERGVELIVISYMGKDGDLENNPWEDLELAAMQVKNLLGCEIGVPDKKVDLKDTFVHETEYKCPDYKGKLLHVKASYDNVKHFIDSLEAARSHPDLVKYLRETDSKKNSNKPKNRFPQTETMMQQYDEELIRAYYLLGQWIASTHLSQKILKKE